MFSMTFAVPWILQVLAILIVADAAIGLAFGWRPVLALRDAIRGRKTLAPSERDRLLALEEAEADRAIQRAEKDEKSLRLTEDELPARLRTMVGDIAKIVETRLLQPQVRDAMVTTSALMADAATGLELFAELEERHRRQRDEVYEQRNRLACVAAHRTLEAGGRAGRFIDIDGSENFRTVVFFDLPDGQVTFHMDERDPEKPWQQLPTMGAWGWDGHSDEQKWRRILAYLTFTVAGYHEAAKPGPWSLLRTLGPEPIDNVCIAVRPGLESDEPAAIYQYFDKLFTIADAARWEAEDDETVRLVMSAEVYDLATQQKHSGRDGTEEPLLNYLRRSWPRLEVVRHA